MPESPRKFEVLINPSRCKGCGLCISVCPQEILSFSATLNRRGVYPSSCEDSNGCVGCLSCADICPDSAITIIKKADKLAS